MFWRSMAVLFLGALSIAQNVSAPAGQFRIAGTVVHSFTGQPLPQLRLSIFRVQTPRVDQAVNADAGGHFLFQGVLPGKYVLVAEGRGFPSQSLDDHLGFSTAVVVGPGKDSEHVMFRVRPESSISGVITDEANEPVRDAQVILLHRAAEEGNESTHWRNQSTTDDQGRYHFAHVFPGTFFVAVMAHPWYAQPGEKDGDPFDVVYPITYFPGSTDVHGATAIVVSPGEKIAADVALVPVPGLRLEIKNPPGIEGNPNLSVTQRVLGTPTFAPYVQTQMKNDGPILLTGIPPGEIEINGISPTNPRDRWKQSLNLSASGTLKVPRQTSASVSGKVVLAATKFRGMQIVLTDRSTRARIFASVDPEGAFQFSDAPIPPGTYQIVVFNAHEAVLASVAATGAKVDGRNLEIADGATVTLTLMMSKGYGQIDGTAVLKDKPVSGAMIVLVPDDLVNNQFMIRRDQSDSDGTFTLPQIVPGPYTVIAFQDGWNLDWQNPAVLKPYLKRGEAVLVGPNHRYETHINVQ